MVDNTLLVNLALQSFGSRTTVTTAELLANSTNEAIQANLTLDNTRDSLLRMAPWDCALRTLNLIYITSTPGTPENTSAATPLWQQGQPRPPWAYEYQYPVDCLRACWIIPSSQTGMSGVPITTAVTGYSPTSYLGGPIVFKVGIDNFIMVNSATPNVPGTGNAVGDIIFVANELNAARQPQGAPVILIVTGVDGSGGITSVSVSPQILGEGAGGSYFYLYTTAPGIGSTSGSGVGSTFNLVPSLFHDQRVIYTNQQFATLVYVKRVIDPSVWDPEFQDAFTNKLGADLCMALTGDKTLANMCIQRANASIKQARQDDGNEGLTINDVVPDWIRIRGIDFDNQYLGPYGGFDWGGYLPLFG